MYQTHKIYIKADMKISDLIKENHRLLLLLQHLGIDFLVGDKTVSRVCSDNSMPLQLFLLLGNLYNEFNPNFKAIGSEEDILVIIRFLKNSHNYYKTDKYPEIIGFIKELQDKAGNEEVKLIEKFFEDYFDEVLEHLDYEDETAFPYFTGLIEQNNNYLKTGFSVNEYREHHTDIETKLGDLKNLLLKHIHIPTELSLRRKLFSSLLELEYDLQIHALIEEKILLPLVTEVEKHRTNG
jgi:regulator of cell morphogenesis and NO signaling